MKTLYSTRPGVAACALAMAGSMLLLGACASVPVSTQPLAVAEASVQHASTADTSADAPRELQVATGKLAAAREAEARRDHKRASQLAEQAELDAQVAELHAQTVRAERAAAETQEANRVLEEELSRTSAR